MPESRLVTTETRREVGEGTFLAAYGTLRHEPVLEALLGRVPATTNGVMGGWVAVCIDGLPFPTLKRLERGQVPVSVFTDLTDDEWDLLDEFEDDRYVLGTCTAETENGEQVEVRFYCEEAYAEPDETIWPFVVFRDLPVAEWYTKMCKKWAEGYRKP